MITINRNWTASFDVDAQKGFTPICLGELPVPGGDEIANALNEQATFAKFRVGSKDAHSPNALWVATEENPQFDGAGLEDYPDLDIRWNSHCNVGTKGFELLDGLPHPMAYDFFIYKGVEDDVHPYGACYHDLGNERTTGVIEYLKGLGVVNVIVGGLATDYCVANTAKQLASAGFEVIVNLKACRGIGKETIDKACEEMKQMGITIVDSLEQIEVTEVNEIKS